MQPCCRSYLPDRRVKTFCNDAMTRAPSALPPAPGSFPAHPGTHHQHPLAGFHLRAVLQLVNTVGAWRTITVASSSGRPGVSWQSNVLGIAAPAIYTEHRAIGAVVLIASPALLTNPAAYGCEQRDAVANRAIIYLRADVGHGCPTCWARGGAPATGSCSSPRRVVPQDGGPGPARLGA
jgi:hypothetical protein